MNTDNSKLKPAKHLGGFALLPAAAGTCAECATAHAADLPHNQQSIFYQYKFYGDHGRWPTWDDAMKHCAPDMQKFWREALAKEGVKI